MMDKLNEMKETLERQLDEWDMIKSKKEVDETHPFIREVQRKLLDSLSTVNHRLHQAN